MATDITAITASNVDDEGVGISHSFRGLFSEARPFEVDILDASVAAQKAAQVDVTVQGAALGDFVLLSGVEIDTTGSIFYASVTAANTVTITSYNTEGADANATLATTARRIRGVVLKANVGRWAELV